jgi:hypothetical protein
MGNLIRSSAAIGGLTAIAFLIVNLQALSQGTPQPEKFFYTGGVSEDVRLSLECGPVRAAKIHPAVATDENGRYAVAWLDGRDGYFDLYVQFYSRDGMVGGNLKVNQGAPVAYGGTGGRSGAFTMACNNGGDLLVVWERGTESYFQEFRGTYGQYFTMDGSRVGSNFIITSDFITFKSRASVTVAPNGSALIAWFRTHGYPDVTHHYGRVVARGGEAMTGIFTIDDTDGTGIEQWQDWLTSQRVMANGNSWYNVVWGETRDGKPTIRMQRVGQDGTLIGSNLEVASPAVDLSYYAPFIAPLWWSRMLVGWYSRAGSWGGVSPDQRNHLHFRTVAADGSWYGRPDSVAIRLDEDICIGSNGRNRILITGQQRAPIVLAVDTLGHILLAPDTLGADLLGLPAPLTELAIPPSFHDSIPAVLGINTSSYRSARYEHLLHGHIDSDFRFRTGFGELGDDICGASQNNPAYCVSNTGIGLALWEDMSYLEPRLGGVLVDHETGDIIRSLSLQHDELNGSYFSIRCAAMSDGGFAVAYRCTNNAGANNPAYVRRLDRFGEPMGEPIPLMGYTDILEMRATRNGELHIITNARQIWRSRFGPNLTLLGVDEVMDLDVQDIRNDLLDAAIGPDGQITVAWQNDTLYDSHSHPSDFITIRYWGERELKAFREMTIPLEYPWRLPSFRYQDVAIDERGRIAIATVAEPRTEYSNALPAWTNISVLSPEEGRILRRWNLDSAWAQIDHFESGNLLCSWNYKRKVRAFLWDESNDSTAWMQLHEFTHDPPQSEWAFHDYALSMAEKRVRILYESARHGNTGYDIWTGLRTIDTTGAQSPAHLKEELLVLPNMVADQGFLRYRTVAEGHVRIHLYDGIGRLVREYVNDTMASGNHWLDLKVTGLSSGNYFLVMDAATRTVQRMTILR